MSNNIIKKPHRSKKFFSLFICLLAIILLFTIMSSLILNNNSKIKNAKKVKVSTSKIVSPPKNSDSKTKSNTPAQKNEPSTTNKNTDNNATDTANSNSQSTSNTENVSMPGYGVKVENALVEDGKKTVYLTFDDGPSTTVTPKILDTLKNYNVHATFFLLGQMIEENPGSQNIVKRIFNEGNSIGNHSYSHSLKLLYPNNVLNINQFMNEVDRTSSVLKSILGQAFSTRIIRMPGGRVSRVYYKDPNLAKFDNVLKQRGLVSIDWNAYDHDSEKVKEFAPQLINHVENEASNHNKVVILMHDTYSKEETAKALPSIIEYFKSKGYEFKTLY